MSINRYKNHIIQESYVALGDIALAIVIASEAGNPNSSKVKILYIRAQKIRLLLRGLMLEDRLSDETINRYLNCLIKLAQIRNFGAAPTIKLYQDKKLLLFTKGADGVSVKGNKGDDANINVEPQDGEEQLIVEEETEGGVKTFNLSFSQYVVPSISMAIDTGLLSASPFQTNKKIREQGETLTVPLKVTVTKGSKDVTASEVLSPASLDATYQGLLDLPTINGSGSQVISLNHAGVNSAQTYQANVTDGTNTPTNSDNLSFVYPFLFGVSALELTETNLYTQLTKMIQAKSNKEALFDDTDIYPYFGYPSEHGALTRIRDGNGFDATEEFERLGAGGVITPSGLINVVAPAGAGFSGWSKEYIVYRHIAKTDIPLQTYSFEF